MTLDVDAVEALLDGAAKSQDVVLAWRVLDALAVCGADVDDARRDVLRELTDRELPVEVLRDLRALSRTVYDEIEDALLQARVREGDWTAMREVVHGGMFKRTNWDGVLPERLADLLDSVMDKAMEELTTLEGAHSPDALAALPDWLDEAAPRVHSNLVERWEWLLPSLDTALSIGMGATINHDIRAAFASALVGWGWPAGADGERIRQQARRVDWESLYDADDVLATFLGEDSSQDRDPVASSAEAALGQVVDRALVQCFALGQSRECSTLRSQQIAGLDDHSCRFSWRVFRADDGRLFGWEEIATPSGATSWRLWAAPAWVASEAPSPLASVESMREWIGAWAAPLAEGSEDVDDRDPDVDLNDADHESGEAPGPEMSEHETAWIREQVDHLLRTAGIPLVVDWAACESDSTSWWNRFVGGTTWELRAPAQGVHGSVELAIQIPESQFGRVVLRSRYAGGDQELVSLDLDTSAYVPPPAPEERRGPVGLVLPGFDQKKDVGDDDAT